MIYVLLLCLATFLLTLSNGCGKDKVVHESKIHPKNGLIYENSTNKLFSGIIYQSYSNGKMKVKYHFKDGEKHGSYEWYYENGKIKGTGFHKNGLINGKYVHYNPDGKIKYSQYYVDGVLNGEYISYYPSGNLDWKAEMRNGKAFGKRVRYYDNGKMREQGYLYYGSWKGERLIYYNNGKLQDKCNYDGGLRNGIYMGYHKNGSIKEQGRYKEDKRQGLFVYYDDSGRIFKKCRYLNDKKSQNIVYDKTGDVVSDYIDRKIVMCEGKNPPVTFEIPNSGSAFTFREYDALVIYPFLRKYLGYKKEFREHPLFDGLCKIISAQMNPAYRQKYLYKAQAMAAKNQSDVIATMFIFYAQQNHWKPIEWCRRIRLCIRAVDRDSFYPYFLNWIKAKVEKSPPPMSSLRNKALSFAAENVLSVRESQYIFRLIDACTPCGENIDISRQIQKIDKKNIWLRKVLQGNHHISKAWEARGGGWGSTVTESGWEGFNKHLQWAEKSLTEAWAMHKELPEAATLMITVSKGSGSVNERIRWFNRAVQAQADYHSAYDTVSSSLLPRWSGSIELLVKLGDACFDSGLFQANIPLKMFFYYKRAASEQSYYLWQTAYRQPGVMKKIERCLNYWCFERGSKNPQNGDYFKTSLAIFNFYAGNYRKVQDTINELGIDKFAEFEKRLLKYNSNYFVSWISVSESMKHYQKKYVSKLIEAEKSYLCGNYQDALVSLEDLLKDKNLTSDARKFISELWGRYNLRAPAYNYKYSKSALYQAIEQSKYDLVERLIENGADVNQKNEMENTPLYFATVVDKDIIAIKLLIKHGADVNVRNKKKSTLLGMIVGKPHPDIVAFLIKSGADVNMRGVKNMTPLMQALYKKQFANVKLLVKAGADVNAKVGSYRIWDYVMHTQDPKITAYMKTHGAK